MRVESKVITKKNLYKTMYYLDQSKGEDWKHDNNLTVVQGQLVELT